MSARAAPWIALAVLAPAVFAPGVLLAPQAAAWQCMPDPGGVCAWVQDHAYVYVRCVVDASFDCVVVVIAQAGGASLAVCIDEDGVRVSHDRTCGVRGEGALLP